MDIPPTSPFALGKFSFGGDVPFDGVVVGDWVVPLADTPAAAPSVFDDWDRLVDVLSRWVRKLPGPAGHIGMPLAQLHIHPPVSPKQVFQAGANYREHLIEIVVAQEIERKPGETVHGLRARAASMMDERAAHGKPFVLIGLPSAICGALDDVILPDRGTQHDWELELGVVIGKPARDVSRDKALDYIAAYTIVNDITTRDLVFRPDIPGIGGDFLASKNAPTFSPTGPVLVPAAYVDPSDLRIVLRLNGEVMQDSKTSDMLFDVARLVEHVSAITELLPGDLLMTGSPAGNGAHHGRFLRSGDVLEGEITGLGMQRNRCVSR